MARIAAPVLVLMGVSGSGKSTVAAALAEKLGWPMLEGDDLHPPANVAKMAAGIPLVDEDRWPWLRSIAAWIDQRIANYEPGIVTCSALKRVYRDVLRRERVVFVHLSGENATIASRLQQRRNHYMSPNLLGSQLETLENLGPDEQGFVVGLAGTPAQQADDIIRTLESADRA